MLYKQNVRRIAHYSGGKFRFDVMGDHRTELNVVSSVPTSTVTPWQTFTKQCSVGIDACI
jgi:hypothetical protein